MNDFKIEMDTTILTTMSNELDRLGYGRRAVFDAVPISRGKINPINNKIGQPFNKYRYAAVCCVCNFNVPVQTVEEQPIVHSSNMVKLDNKTALLVCSDRCREVYEINPLPYESFTLFEDIYIPGT